MTTISPVAIAFEHILVPTDFSDVSDRAVEYGKAIAKQSNAELLLAHVNQPVNPVAPAEGAWIDQDEIEEQYAQQLEESGEALRVEGFRAKAISLTGPLQDEILKAVKSYNIDLIVLGTHGRGGFERFLLGSEAEAMLRRAPCPVLTLGPAAPAPKQIPWRPREVLCATTLSTDSASVASYAYLLARHYGARFLLFHVEGTAWRFDADWEAFDFAFRQHLPQGMEVSAPLQTWLTDTAPGTNIVEVAKKRGSDLIVMGAPHTMPAMAHVVRDTVSKVLAEAHCPVMTLHQD